MDNMSNMLQAYENNQKQFFQNVSHELRTPLMSIRGYAEGIRENIVDKDTAVDIILSWESRMTDLVNGLLYISRIDEGLEAPKNTVSVDVKNLLFSCYERVKPVAAKAQKEITINAPDSDITINTDEEKLERAIINILSNAIRHAKSSVLISYKNIEDNLEISIQDDGDGISPKDLPRIFERFYKGNKGNSGLGLAISKDIVKSLNGKIRAENILVPDTGAVFTVVLPGNNGTAL
jgi:signal transduction histidine kinase